MHAPRWVTLAVLAGVSPGLPACGTDHPGEVIEEPSVDAAVTLQPSVITPSQTAMVTCTAAVPPSLMLSQASLRIEAFDQDTTIGLPPYSVGTQRWYLQLNIPTGPIEGEVHFRLVARLQDVADSADATLRIEDDGPPRLRLHMPVELQPPDSLPIALEAEDAAGIVDLTLHVRGAAYRDIAMQYQYERNATLTHRLWFPLSTALGDSIVVTAETHDGFGKAGSQYQRILTVDNTYPTVVAQVDTVQHTTTPIDIWGFPLLFLPGDSVHVHVRASDNYALASVGFEYLGVRDSILTDSLSQEVDFQMQVPGGVNTDAPIWGFAYDQARHYGGQAVLAWVLDGQFRPITEQLRGVIVPNVWAVDLRQDIMYFSDFSRSLHRLGLTPLTPMPSIDMMRYAMSVGLSPAGDSLWVLLTDEKPLAQRPPALVGWDLARGMSAMDTIPLPELASCYAHAMQITITYHALVTGWLPTGCPTVDVDLRTRTRRLLNLHRFIELNASPDLSTVVAWGDSGAMVYLPEPDSLGPVRTTCCRPGETPNRWPAFDRSGASILLHNRLYDRFMSAYRWLGPEQKDLPGVAAMSLDGSTAFVSGLPGYWKFDTASGGLSERIILPMYADRLILHPDGRRLFVFSVGWVGVVDLR